MKKPKVPTQAEDYKQVSRVDVPSGRKGKHNSVIAHIMKDLKGLKQGLALKIAFTELPDTKENIRSALNRASRNAGIRVATAADEKFLYIWNKDAE